MALPPSKPLSLKLPRERVLKVQSDFEDLKQNGERFVGRCFVANWRREPEAVVSRFAVIAGKKVGNAVHRNRLKRLLREVFRLNQYHLPHTVSLVLVARRALWGKVFVDVDKEFRFFLKKTGLWIS